MRTLPRWLLAVASAAALFALVPLVGLGARADWAALPARLSDPATLTALGLSLRTSVAATVLCVVLGVPLGVALSRLRGGMRAGVRALLLAPLVLPPVVSGLALLAAFGRRGLLGSTLDGLGVSIAFSTVAVVIAQTFVALPFMVASVEGVVSRRNGRLEGMAGILGAGRSRTFLEVTLPGIAPAIATGAVLAFARSLGEFGATLTFAGSLEGVTRTAPLLVYLARESDPQVAITLGLVMVALAVAVVAGATWREDAARAEGGRR